MTPRIDAAIAALQQSDLKIRSTFRDPDIKVWTSLLPTYRQYETTLLAPPELLRDYLLAYGDIDVMSDTPGDAHHAHDVMCKNVRALLDQEDYA